MRHYEIIYRVELEPVTANPSREALEILERLQQYPDTELPANVNWVQTAPLVVEMAVL
jgi:hypothetical protein